MIFLGAAFVISIALTLHTLSKPLHPEVYAWVMVLLGVLIGAFLGFVCLFLLWEPAQQESLSRWLIQILNL